MREWDLPPQDHGWLSHTHDLPLATGLKVIGQVGEAGCGLLGHWEGQGGFYNRHHNFLRFKPRQLVLTWYLVSQPCLRPASPGPILTLCYQHSHAGGLCCCCWACGYSLPRPRPQVTRRAPGALIRGGGPRLT